MNTASLKQDKMRPALAVFLLALVVRLLHLAASRGILDYEFRLNDGMFFDALAWSFVRGVYDFSMPVVGLSPVYVGFLTVCYGLFGHSMVIPRIIQLVFAAASCVGLQQIAHDLFGERAGWIAGLLAAFCGIFIYFDMLLIKASLTNTLFIFFLWAIYRNWQVRNGPIITAGCAAFAMACMLRMQLMLSILWVGVWGVREAWRRGKAAWLVGLICILSMAGTYALFQIWVGAAIRHTQNVPPLEDVIPAQSGIHFYVGNAPTANGTYHRVTGIRPSAIGHVVDAKKLAEATLHKPLSVAEVNQFWTNMAIKSIREDPWRWVKLEAKKFFLVWNAYEIPNSHNYDYWREFSWILKFPLVSYGWLAPLALLGWVGLRSDKRPMIVFLKGLAVFYILGLLLTFVTADYRLPLHPIWILFSAYALDQLWALGACGNFRLLRTQIIYFTVFFIFCNYATYLHPGNFNSFMKKRHSAIFNQLPVAEKAAHPLMN